MVFGQAAYRITDEQRERLFELSRTELRPDQKEKLQAIADAKAARIKRRGDFLRSINVRKEEAKR
jgi:hypothetical protein